MNLDGFTIIEKIELLQRSILVNSYAYYMLDSNILTDFQYDANTRVLRQLKQDYPDEYAKSRYFKYFKNFNSGTGFNLIGLLEDDKELRSRIISDAMIALKLKEKGGC